MSPGAGRTLNTCLMADLHGARFRAPGLADVPDAGAGDRHHPRIARFAVVGGDRRGALEGLTIGVGAGWALEDDVAAWDPPALEPCVGGWSPPDSATPLPFWHYICYSLMPSMPRGD